jgi:hypothetical protein
MDGQKQSDPPVAADAPAKQQNHSFMDIRGPKAKPETAPIAPEPTKVDAEPTPEKPAETPAVAPPPEEVTGKSDNPAEKLEEPKKAEIHKPPKPSKPPRQPGVGLAIFATMVIVLGLAALATYAYLRTNNIAPF